MPDKVGTTISLVNGSLLAEFPDGSVPPGAEVELRLGGVPVAKARLPDTGDGPAQLSFALPEAAQNDGVSLLDLHALPDGSHLARYTLFCGAAVPEDFTTALALLQAEVQTLKRAFMADAAVPKLTLVERPLLIAEAVEQSLAALATPDPDTRSEG